MTWTFNTPFDNVARVRFNIGDIDPNRVIFTDEIISAAITEYTTWQAASIALIQNIIFQLLSQPDFKADWLQSDYKTSLQYYKDLLIFKAHELNVPLATVRATARYMWRPDSNQQQEPTYPKSPINNSSDLSF